MKQNDQKIGMRESFNLLYAAAKVHAMCFWPIMRRDFGTDAFGFPAFFALVLMVLLSGLARMPELLVYVVVWLVCVALARMRTFLLVRQGTVWHSRYEGYPWMALCIPFVRTEARAKGLIEPLLCLLTGALFYQRSENLGVFFMAGAFSMVVLNCIYREIDRKQLAAMRDAEIEQRWLVARYRGEVDE